MPMVVNFLVSLAQAWSEGMPAASGANPFSQAVASRGRSHTGNLASCRNCLCFSKSADSNLRSHSMRLSMRWSEESVVKPVRRVGHADETGSLGQRRSWSPFRKRVTHPWSDPSCAHDSLAATSSCCLSILPRASAVSEVVFLG